MSKAIIQPKERKRGLPPDPDKVMGYSNRQRALWALAAVQEFQRLTGSDNETAVGDLLVDMMHMCNYFPEMGPMHQQHHNAVCHYQAETGLDPQG